MLDKEGTCCDRQACGYRPVLSSRKHLKRRQKYLFRTALKLTRGWCDGLNTKSSQRAEKRRAYQLPTPEQLVSEVAGNADLRTSTESGFSKETERYRVNTAGTQRPVSDDTLAGDQATGEEDAVSHVRRDPDSFY